MILALPLISSEDVAAALRPGGILRADSALRTLRENGVAAPQMSVVPRSGRTVRGRIVWYSSLMLDVARSHRWHDREGAAKALMAAAELSQHRSALHVMEMLSIEPDAEPHRLDQVTGGALTRLAVLTESRRQGLPGREREGHSTGVVVDRIDGLAIVDTGEATRLGVSTPVEPTQVAAVGSLVAVEIERFDNGSSFVTVRPAFEASPDSHSRVPGTPHLLSESRRRRIRYDVLVVA